MLQHRHARNNAQAHRLLAAPCHNKIQAKSIGVNRA